MTAKPGAVFCGTDREWMEKASRAFRGAHVTLFRSDVRPPSILLISRPEFRTQLEENKAVLSLAPSGLLCWFGSSDPECWKDSWHLFLKAGSEMRWKMAVYLPFSYADVPAGVFQLIENMELEMQNGLLFWKALDYSQAQLEDSFIRILTEERGWFGRSPYLDRLEPIQRRPLRASL